MEFKKRWKLAPYAQHTKNVNNIVEEEDKIIQLKWHRPQWDEEKLVIIKNTKSFLKAK